MKKVKKFKSRFNNGKYINCDFCKDAREFDEVYELKASHIKPHRVLSLCLECLMEVKQSL